MNDTLDRRRLLTTLGMGAFCALINRPALAAQKPAVGAFVEGDDLPAQEASWYRKLPEGRIECQLCPRACQVADLERGGCGVRENRNGTYYTLVHSLACSVHIDPIEKKPFFHVLPGREALSFATAGCNVECKFCQNWEISQFRPEQVRAQFLPPDALAQAARKAGVPLISATYSEPVVFWEYVRDTAIACRRVGVRSSVVSNGFIQDKPLKEVLPHLTAMKVDLKSFRETFYRDLVRGELKPVLQTIETIKKQGVWLELVVLIIPNQNDSPEEIRDLARWVKVNLGPDVPIHLTRFHPTYRLTNLPPTPISTLERSWEIARTEGLQFAYLGNVPGHPGENTVCPGCNKVLIRRVGFKVVENRIRQNRCPDCQRHLPGVWS